MSGTTTAAIAAAVVLALLLIVAAGGLFSVRTSTGVSGPVTAEGPGIPLPEGTSALVFGSRMTSAGFSLLGLRFTQPEYAASVAFVPPPGCTPAPGDELVPEGPCEEIPALGQVNGSGVNADGHNFVMVSVPISQSCFDVLRDGDPWPSERSECAAHRQ